MDRHFDISTDTKQIERTYVKKTKQLIENQCTKSSIKRSFVTQTQEHTKRQI